MKNPFLNRRSSDPGGFALVVTLALMVLVVVIAMGLLSLATISLRTSGQGNASATARSNARLALMLAVGELQKMAGPDKSVTATSEIVSGTPGKTNVTGVWNSWDFDVKSPSLDYDSPRTQSSSNGVGFKGWLVSEGKVGDTASREYVKSPFTGGTIELVGKDSFGGTISVSDKVEAGRVSISRSGQRSGAYAWHVSDESVKARINTYRDAGGNLTMCQQRAMAAGHRPDVSVMENKEHAKLDFLPDDTEDYVKATASVPKILSLGQVELLDNSSTIKSFRHDVTPYSLGLMTNVREGGLKQDLTSLFELTNNGNSGTTGLPAAFSGKRLYQTNVYSNGSAVTGVSDPYWSALAGYYNSYKDLLTPEDGPTYYKTPVETVNISQNTPQPAQYYPYPVIAKIELMFSLLARDKHGPHKGLPGDYAIHLLYIPIVTLHNPYNVNLRFDRMKIGISDVPVGFKFYVNNTAKNNKMTPLANLFSIANGRKEFWIEIANWPSSTATNPTGQITMKPGQTKIFGPYINANEPFGDDFASYFDFGNNKTGTENDPLKAKPGFTGGTYGYDVDWLNGGLLTVKKSDLVAVEFKTVASPAATNFKVSATITSKNVTRNCGGLNFTYANQANLDKVLPDLMRFPKTGGIVAEAMHLGNYANPAGSLKAQSFALFSAYARTANGGVDTTGSRSRPAGTSAELPDGRLSGNPFLHNSAARVAISSVFSAERPATQSHELNLLKLDGSADNVISFAADFRTNYLTNYKQVNGRSIKSGSYLEIPSGPLQAIADFRRSNALSSPYLPAFVQPVGNSYASPLIQTDTVLQSGVASYQLMDHSFLANHALYDRTYFSTLAPVAGKSAKDGFNEFMSGEHPLLSQAFQSYLPEGKTVEDAEKELFSGNGKPTASAYRLAAQYQMVKGPFNVNSTRVQAWKAILSSMSKSELVTLWAKSGSVEKKTSSGVPVPAMTLHNGGATGGSFSVANIDDHAANEWNGYREFSDNDIEKLTTNIVEEVRRRGPFLSLSEFVNRRIGSDSDLTRTGALQAAINNSKLNDAVFTSQVPVTAADVADPAIYDFRNPIAATGNPAAGAPGWLNQADILKLLEPAVTVRADTFVIRTCGEATDAAGNLLARAYLEAVVQRIPEYVNPIDPPTASIPNPNAPVGMQDPTTPQLASAENITFGRRFVVVSFKWLSENEI